MGVFTGPDVSGQGHPNCLGETTGVHKGNGAQKNNWQSNEFFVVRTIISKMKDCVTWQERLGRERDALGGPSGTIRR